MQLAEEQPWDSSAELSDGYASDASEEETPELARFFAPVVDRGLGAGEGSSCWLFNDPESAGAYKLVACVQPRDVDLLAAQVHDNCAELRAVSGAKLYLGLATDLLVIVYLSNHFDRGADDVRVAFDSLILIDFRPCNAVAEGGVAPLWVGLSHLSNSPAVPFDAWIANNDLL